MKRLISFLCMIGACWYLQSCGPMGGETPAKVDNGPAMKARYMAINTAFQTGVLDGIDTLLATNSVDHSADTSMHLPDGPEGLKQMIKMMREGVPDLKSEIKMMVAEGDVLMVYGTTSGTNTGSMMGMPASGKAFSSDFVDVVKFGDDLKATDHWGVYDNMKMMMDMGAITWAPPPPAKKK